MADDPRLTADQQDKFALILAIVFTGVTVFLWQLQEARGLSSAVFGALTVMLLLICLAFLVKLNRRKQ